MSHEKYDILDVGPIVFCLLLGLAMIVLGSYGIWSDHDIKVRKIEARCCCESEVKP